MGKVATLWPMPHHPDEGETPERPPGAPAACLIAAGTGWQVSDVVCRLGPQDRPFEERHAEVSIALVLEGSFRYRSDQSALLYPGAFLLGNAGACFVCGHEHGVGDRCLALRLAPDFFAEIAASAVGSSRFRFPASMLPASRKFALPRIESEARRRQGLAMEEWVVGLVEAVLATLAGGAHGIIEPSARDRRRISDVLRHIEENCQEKLDLSGLARVARMSRYHFLRTFRRALGLTPYQFVLNVRMRRAAAGLSTSPAPISTIAFEAGFGDLSTFNARFRDLFGKSPSAFRRSGQTDQSPRRSSVRASTFASS
ncbi:MAG TPA: AraC family transcriptional regulator [Acetobacteraceae bacterium]|nr:AraC family transcriptional regulator [Acetobacteraceae bacterium]